MSKTDNLDVIAAIEAAESLALQGAISQERKEALDAYLGRPYGNEQPGRSQIVSKDTSDTVGWVLPTLMKMFCSGDQMCVFDPTSAEDLKQAEQESDYVSFVISQRNNWFDIAYSWFWDGLVSKTGYVKAWWEEQVEAPLESYRGLNDQELSLILQDQNTEVVGHNSYFDELGTPLHDVDVKRKKVRGYVKIKAIAPEQVLVAHNHREVCLKDASFVEHWEWKTISEIRDEGFDVEDDITDESSTVEAYWENVNRNEFWADNETDSDLQDPSARRVKVRDVWIRFDKDGDGIAELMHYILVGKTVLEESEVDFIPIAAVCPNPLPHQHYGQSLADQTMDIQEIKTYLLRGHIDNVALANYGRYAINTSRVNLDDMLQSRPGGLVRVDGDPMGAIFPFNHPDMGASILQSVEYLDQVRENRTGTNRYFTGIDQNSLNKTATGISQLMNASQMRVELIARSYAEGVKELFRIVHGITLRNSRQPEIIRLRNEWVPVDPRSWVDRYDITVSVGLGTGNKDSQMMHIEAILNAMEKAFPLGICTKKNIYNALVKFTQNAGYKATEEFWTDPDANPQANQPPPPSPEMILAQAQAQKSQADFQLSQQKTQQQLALEQQKAEKGFELEQWKAQQQAELEKYKAELKAQSEIEISQAKAHVDAQLKATEMEMQNHRDAISQMHELSMSRNQMIDQQEAGREERFMNALTQIAAIADKMNKPKKVIRDANGRVSGVE